MKSLRFTLKTAFFICATGVIINAYALEVAGKVGLTQDKCKWIRKPARTGAVPCASGKVFERDRIKGAVDGRLCCPEDATGVTDIVFNSDKSLKSADCVVPQAYTAADFCAYASTGGVSVKEGTTPTPKAPTPTPTKAAVKTPTPTPTKAAAKTPTPTPRSMATGTEATRKDSSGTAVPGASESTSGKEKVLSAPTATRTPSPTPRATATEATRKDSSGTAVPGAPELTGGAEKKASSSPTGGPSSTTATEDARQGSSDDDETAAPTFSGAPEDARILSADLGVFDDVQEATQKPTNTSITTTETAALTLMRTPTFKNQALAGSIVSKPASAAATSGMADATGKQPFMIYYMSTPRTGKLVKGRYPMPDFKTGTILKKYGVEHDKFIELALLIKLFNTAEKMDSTGALKRKLTALFTVARGSKFPKDIAALTDADVTNGKFAPSADMKEINKAYFAVLKGLHLSRKLKVGALLSLKNIAHTKSSGKVSTTLKYFLDYVANPANFNEHMLAAYGPYAGLIFGLPVSQAYAAQWQTVFDSTPKL